MGVFGVFTGLGKAFWDLAFNRGRGNTINSKLLKDAMGSEILDGGQKVIEGMRLTTGVGEPEDGDRFGQGWSRFKDATEALTSAFPNDSWTGEGADAYIGQNRTQAGRTNAVALLDRGVQTVIAREAYQVAYHRDKLDDQSNFLADLSYVTMALGLVPGYGKAMKATVEAAAVQAALSICSLELYELSREANQNAAELQQAVGRYNGAAETTAPTTTATPSAPPPPPPPPAGGSAPQGQVHQDPARVGSADSVAQAPAAVPGPTPNVTASPPPPAAAQLPATPAAPADGLAQLGAALAPLGALLAGATQPAAQTPPAAPATPVAAAMKSTKKKDDEEQDEDEDKDKATSGHEEGEVERAPIDAEADADPARLHAPMTVTLDQDRPPTPPATAPQA